MLSMALVAAVTVLGPVNPQVWEKTAVDELKTYLEKRLGDHEISVDGERNPVFHVGDGEVVLEGGCGGDDGGHGACHSVDVQPVGARGEFCQEVVD